MQRKTHIKDALNLFMLDCPARRLTPSTQKFYRTKFKLLPSSPLTNIKRSKVECKVILSLGEAEVRAVLKAWDYEWDTAIVLFIMDTAVRTVTDHATCFVYSLPCFACGWLPSLK